MTCPVCNCETKVTYTYTNTDHILRNRKCDACGYRFRTIETDEDIYVRLEKKGKLRHAKNK